MNRAASAPSRTLSRRKLVKNRITIDTDLVFHGNNNNSNDTNSSRHHSTNTLLSQHAPLQPNKSQGEDTDRWVEEQFNLGCYEDQCDGIDLEQVKETDILSDDDEYCKSVRAVSAKKEVDKLHLQVTEGGLYGRDEDVIQEEVERIKLGDDSASIDSFASCGVSVPQCAGSTVMLAPLKQCAVEGVTNQDHEAIWVRRDDFTNGCNGNVF